MNRVLDALPKSNATPFGRGKSKKDLENRDSFEAYAENTKKCIGKPFRFYTKDKNDTFKTGSRVCDLCGSRGVSFICTGGCKRVLCLEKDRSELILKRLEDKKIGPTLRSRFPVLANLGRKNVPAYYCDAGAVNGQTIFVGQSCFDIAHPERLTLVTPKNSVNDDQLSAVAVNTAEVTSPLR